MTEFEFLALAELRAIRALLERRDADEPSLLKAIHAAVRGTAFTASELVRHARLPANSDLQTALVCEFDDPNSRRIGKWLAANAGRPVGGFIAENVGRERDGLIWRVQVCHGKHTLPMPHE